MAERTAAEEARTLGAITMAEAARRLGVPTRQIVEDVVRHRIRFVLVRGVPHIPEDVIAEYRVTSL